MSAGSPVWVGDRLVDPGEARVSPFDHGVLVGDGVFETLKTIDGRPFALTRHLRRLHRSAAALDLAVPGDDRIRDAVRAVLQADSSPLGRLRITVTGGPGPLGSDRGDEGSTLLVAHTAAKPWGPSSSIATVPWPRNERGALAGVKSTSYGENVIALNHAHERGADEAVFADTQGRLSEGTGSNIFLVLGGELVTPSLATGCLAGITRELVCELVPVLEREVPIEALVGADEVFLTSSTRDVHPVAVVDGRPVAACPGLRTAEAAAAFSRLVASEIDP